MVDDRITDPRRIAELLASETTGLETGPLADLAVVDPRSDASPSPEGTPAYGLDYRNRRVGTVSLYPGYVEVSLAVDSTDAAEETALPVEPTAEGIRVRVEDGVGVKRSVDVIRAALAELAE